MQPSKSPEAAPSVNWRTTAFLSMAEAARVAGVSRATLYALAHGRRLRLRKLGRKTLVETASLAELIAAAPSWRPGRIRSAKPVGAKDPRDLP